jgi:hypothetical protein
MLDNWINVDSAHMLAYFLEYSMNQRALLYSLPFVGFEGISEDMHYISYHCIITDELW